MSSPLRIFIGWDSKEPIAFSVLAHSILKRATIPISLVPLTRRSVAHLYRRDRGPTEATEFSLTRFLVPALSDYDGLSVFMDSDMLCLVDLVELQLALLMDPGHAVWVCPHDYTPSSTTKFLNQPQTTYPCKNWSSFMVFDNAKCRMLTPDYVNTASGLELHRFLWLEGKRERLVRYDGTLSERPLTIGTLPLAWNWLVGEYEPNDKAKILHYTLGGPYFPEYRDCDQADLWRAEYLDMIKPSKAIELALAQTMVVR